MLVHNPPPELDDQLSGQPAGVAEGRKFRWPLLSTLQHMKRATRLTMGGALIGLGILGVILPVMPGVPFLFLGLYLLGVDRVCAAQNIERLEERFPRWRKALARVRRILHSPETPEPKLAPHKSSWQDTPCGR